MIRLPVLSILFFCGLSGLAAAEPAPLPGTRPGGGPGPGGPVGRLLMTYEVEAIVVKADDKVAMTRWAELAGQGYHVVGCSSQSGGGMLVLLERTGAPGMIQVPRIVAADKEAADQVRFSVAAALRDRFDRSVPVPGPSATAASGGK